MIPKGTFESVGGAAGAALGRGLANITGCGQYVFNDIVSAVNMPTRNKRFHKQSISHCEFVQNLTSEGGSAFNVKSFAINPAEKITFPWMNRYGQLFAKYRFTQLLLEYRSNTSDYAASGPLGSVIIAPVYNVVQDEFVNKQQMEGCAHCVSTKPSNSIVCGFECARSDDAMQWRYVRKDGEVATNLTDPGRFSIATSGLPNAAGTALEMGEIWVHYTVDFEEPVLTLESLELDGVHGGFTTWNALIGRLATGLAGLSWGNQTSATWDLPGVPQGAVTTSAGTVPSGDFFVAMDTTNPFRYWFHNPGKYHVIVKVDVDASVAVIGTGQMYGGALSSGIGSVTQSDIVSLETSGVDRNFVSEFVIDIRSENAAVTFFVNPAYTNLALVRPSGNTSGNYSGFVRFIAL